MNTKGTKKRFLVISTSERYARKAAAVKKVVAKIGQSLIGLMGDATQQAVSKYKGNAEKWLLRRVKAKLVPYQKDLECSAVPENHIKQIAEVAANLIRKFEAKWDFINEVPQSEGKKRMGRPPKRDLKACAEFLDVSYSPGETMSQLFTKYLKRVIQEIKKVLTRCRYWGTVQKELKSFEALAEILTNDPLADILGISS